MNKFRILLFFIIFILSSTLSSNAIIHDTFIEETLKTKKLEQPEVNLNYNYESFEKIPIPLKLVRNITTKNHAVYEGQELKFIVKRNIKYNKKIIIKQGTIVTARIETYITRGMNGIPATLIIDNFEIPGIEKTKIKGPFIKKGISLTTMVLPIKWALTPIPGVGSLTNFIIGCNANLTDKDNIFIYYYPNWN